MIYHLPVLSQSICEQLKVIGKKHQLFILFGLFIAVEIHDILDRTGCLANLFTPVPTLFEKVRAFYLSTICSNS